MLLRASAPGRRRRTPPPTPAPGRGQRRRLHERFGSRRPLGEAPQEIGAVAPLIEAQLRASRKENRVGRPGSGKRVRSRRPRRPPRSATSCGGSADSSGRTADRALRRVRRRLGDAGRVRRVGGPWSGRCGWRAVRCRRTLRRSRIRRRWGLGVDPSPDGAVDVGWSGSAEGHRGILRKMGRAIRPRIRTGSRKPARSMPVPCLSPLLCLIYRYD